MSRFSYFLSSVLILSVTSCDSGFQPIVQDGDQYFSVFGVLDASADTNWIRVMPIRNSIITEKAPERAKVTITRIKTGDIIELRDSLLNPRPGVFLLNYYTTKEIFPAEDYLFKAENKEGKASTASITIPADFPLPLVHRFENSPIARIYVNGVENLSSACVYYYFLAESTGKIHKEIVPQHSDIRSTETGFVVYSYPQADMSEISSYHNSLTAGIQHLWQEVQIVSGNSNWPDYENFDEDDYLPHENSNINNGTGILAGAVSKTVPFQSCYDDEGGIIACEELRPATPW